MNTIVHFLVTDGREAGQNEDERKLQRKYKPHQLCALNGPWIIVKVMTIL